MWICLLLFVIISSGSIFATTYFNKRYEETVPLTIFSIVLILYISGIIGILKAGVYIVCIIALILYLLSVYKVIRKKQIKSLLTNTFTPALILYSLLFFVLIFGDYNKLCSDWDEFSHWGIIVKSMFELNDFGTNPLSYSDFKTYPPAMSLFQYFVQALCGKFTEWLLYFSYQIFCFSMFLPFLKGLKFKNISKNLLIFISIAIIPAIFYNDFYSSILVDAFLGMLFGFILATVFVNKKYNVINIATIILAVFTLVLTKDAGLLFALVSVMVFVIDLFISNPLTKADKKKRIQKNCVISLIAVFALIFAKLSWKHELVQNNISPAFASKINFKEFILIILGHVVNYRSTVLNNFVKSFFTTGIQIGSLVIYNYQILILLIVGLYFVYWIFKDYNKEKLKRNIFIIWVIIISLILYFIGLLATYMYKFSDYEAINLASYQRYLNIMFTAVIMFTAFALLFIFSNTTKYKKIFIILISILLLSAPYISFINFISRENVRESQVKRAPYTALSEEVKGLINDKNSKIYFISEGNDGSNILIIRFSIRPNPMNNAQWSIGKPFYDGDIWTSDIDARIYLHLL